MDWFGKRSTTSPKKEAIQVLKRFGIIIYVGKRLYDIELMKIELQRLYDAGLMERLDYLEADTVLRREHKQELEFLKKSEVE